MSRSSGVGVAVSLALVFLAACGSQLGERRLQHLTPSHTLTELRQANCLGASYEYRLFSPDTREPLPAIELLHGAGGSSSDLFDAWKPLATRNGIVLIAPQIPRKIEFEAIAPNVFRCLADDARKLVPVDSQRIYLFGYSMGGYLTFDGAMFDSDYFAATAVFAAVISREYYPIVDHASRKIPVGIYIGDHDQYVSVAEARETRDLLTSHGFPVRYLEIEGVDHNYGAVAGTVNRDAWAFLSAHRLPEERKNPGRR